MMDRVRLPREPDLQDKIFQHERFLPERWEGVPFPRIEHVYIDSYIPYQGDMSERLGVSPIPKWKIMNVWPYLIPSNSRLPTSRYSWIFIGIVSTHPFHGSSKKCELGESELDLSPLPLYSPGRGLKGPGSKSHRSAKP